jgi:DNA-binding transcriptional ArsR family regulator
MPAERNTQVVRDPRRIRAFLHPARIAILDALATGEERTATEYAELTGLSPSATSYHLKFLERYGLAEHAPARKDGRERPWRAPDRRAQLELDTSTPAGAAATAAVGLAILDSSRALAEEFISAGSEEPAEWRDATSLASTDLWLTVEETRAATAALASALDPYRGRPLAGRPDGSRRVRVMNLVSPHHRRDGV